MKYFLAAFTFALILSACVSSGQVSQTAIVTSQSTQQTPTPQATSTLQPTPTSETTPTPIMEPSDWIATAALGTTIIVSIAGFVFNYLTNKQNIKARHAEMIAEKSLEAFSEIVEGLMNASDHFYNLLDHNNIGSEKTEAQETLVAIQEIRKFHRKYRVYFPEIINKDVYRLFRRWEQVKHTLIRLLGQERLVDIVSSSDMDDYYSYKVDEIKDRMGKEYSDVFADTKKIIEHIQRYIGVETQESLEDNNQE